jgi:hypothetical protein
MHHKGIAVSRSGRRRLAGALVLASALATVAACSGSMTSPSVDGRGLGAETGAGPLAATGAGSSVRLTGQLKFDVCHRTEGTNEFILINIADPALEAHIAHGDAKPGDPVPGMESSTFGPNCEIEGGDPVPD